MDVPSRIGVRREFKIPKPEPLPLSLFAIEASNEKNPQSDKKSLPTKKKLELRPLAEVLSSTDYKFYFGSTKEPNRTDTQADKCAKSKFGRESVLNKPKIRQSRTTTTNSPRKQLQMITKKTKKPKINYIEANKNIIKKIVKETPKQIDKNECLSQTNSKNSDKEFVLYEKLFNQYQPSPLTKLCNSLEVSKLENTVDIESNCSTEEIIYSIKKLLHNQEQHHRRFVTNISNLLQKLDDSLSNKENNQIASTEIKKNVNAGYGAPLTDLRQHIFHKNICKKLVYNESHNDDANRQKAYELYNNLKENCNFLCTPKPNSNTNFATRKSLSTRIQEQCLLLVATPKH